MWHASSIFSFGCQEQTTVKTWQKSKFDAFGYVWMAGDHGDGGVDGLPKALPEFSKVLPK